MTTPLHEPQSQALLALLERQNRGVLATIKSDGLPQLSIINFAWQPEVPLIRISVTAGRAKTKNLLRDPRASLQVISEDYWTWTVVEARVELSEVARDPDDAASEELVELYRLVNGEHPDWSDYRAAMVHDRRQVLRLHPVHVYGQAG